MESGAKSARAERMAKIRAVGELEMRAAVEEILRREWPPADAAEEARQTGAYPQLIRDLAEQSDLFNQGLLAQSLVACSEEVFKSRMDRTTSMAIADRILAVRERIVSEEIHAQFASIERPLPSPRDRARGPLFRMVSVLLVASFVAVLLANLHGAGASWLVLLIVLALIGTGAFGGLWAFRAFRRLEQRVQAIQNERFARKLVKELTRRTG